MLRGHLKFMVLTYLGKSPMSGYDLIKTIEENTGWKPSYGSIYPILNSIVKENLATIKIDKRKKVYILNSNGKNELKQQHNEKNKILGSMNESFKMLENVCNINSEFHIYVMNEIQNGKVPFKEITIETQDMQNEMTRLAKSGILEKRKSDVKKVLKDTILKLKKIQ